MLKVVGGFGVIACFIGFTSGLVYPFSSLSVKKPLFQNAEKVMLDSDSEKTRMFAPKTFAEAMEHYKKAESDFDRGKAINNITDELDTSSRLFKQAVQISDQSSVVLKDAADARSDAHKLMASKFKPSGWSIAEDTFRRAVAKMEKGDQDDAKALGEEARVLYRQVEKDTVTLSYMAEIWNKLKIIETMKAGGEFYAPKTYQKAMNLAKQAQGELEKQPYGNDHAKDLVRQAMDQAEYGIKISRCIKSFVNDKKTFEDLFLDSLIKPEEVKTEVHPVEKVTHES
jgi:exonuclease VII small subunit